MIFTAELIRHGLINILVLIYGMLLLSPVFERLGVILTVSISWFVAWTVVVFSYIVFLLVGIQISILSFLSALVSILACVLVWYSKQEKTDYFPQLFNVPVKKYAKTIPAVASMVAAIVYWGDYIHFSPDSSQYDALISMFNRFDVSLKKTDGVHYWLYNARLPFFIIPHSIARLLGVEVYYSFTSLTSFFVLTATTGFWLKCYNEPKSVSYIWLLIILAFLMSNIMVRFHSFYMHSNLLVMAYMSIGCLSLMVFIKTKEMPWFLIGCLLLGSTGIIRKEMLLLSLIPFVVLGFNGLLPHGKTAFFGFCLFGLLSFLWFMNYCIASVDFEGLVNSGIIVTDHGGAEIIILCLLLMVFIFAFPWSVLGKYSIRIFVSLIMGVLFFLYVLDKPELVKTVMELYSLAFKGKGFWGQTWLIFFLSSSLYFLFCFFLKEISPGSKATSFMAAIVLCYFIGRIVIYVMLVDPSADHWGSSGNRVLLHIYPIAVFCIGMIGFEFSVKKNS